MDQLAVAGSETVPPLRATRWRRGIARRLLSARVLAIGLLVLIILWLTLAPILVVIWGSFRDGPPGTPSNFTLSNYVHAFGNPRLLKAMVNSLIFAVGASLLSFAIGSYLAWITERTNMPGRSVIYLLILLPIVVPGIIMTISWVLLLNPTIGILNHVVEMIPGLSHGPFNSYGMLPMIWTEGIDGIALPFLLMASAFRSMDPSLEEASLVSGASRLRTMRHITVPALLPSVLAVIMLLFVKSIEGFEVPAVMGLPAHVDVFSTEIYVATRTFPIDQGLAATFAVAYVAVTAVVLALYYRTVRISEKFATVTGKGFKPSRIDLGRRKWVWSAATMLLMFIAIVLPLLVVIYASLLKFYEVPSRDVWGKMSLHNYSTFFANSRNMLALTNNVEVGVASALAVVLLSSIVSWVILRTRLKGRSLLDAVSFAPIAIPGIAFGLALIWLYLSIPTPVKIYGTLAMLSLGFIAKYLPYGMRASHAGLTQVSTELEEASATCGASWTRTFFRIVAPLIAGSLLVAFVYVLSLTFKVLSLPVMLQGPNTELLSVRIFALYQAGDYSGLAAMGVIIFLILIVLAGISRLVARRIGYINTNDM